MLGDTAIELAGLTITYGDTLAVDDLTLSVMQGERLGLLGPNGAGKTSTLHAICGILQLARLRRLARRNRKTEAILLREALEQLLDQYDA